MKALQKKEKRKTHFDTHWKTEYVCRKRKLGQSLDDGVEAAGSDVLHVAVDLKSKSRLDTPVNLSFAVLRTRCRVNPVIMLT